MAQPVPPPDILREQFEKMIAFVRDADRRVLEGEVVTLTTLDRDVARFCDLLDRADPEVSRDIAPLMAEMVSALEELAQTLRAHCGTLGMTEH
ncbi:MAG: hypothetical protein H6862_05135 [Rhodospirillales bacterium]|nr:hypothetical protein [Rhodospirillales bacterium]